MWKFIKCNKCNREYVWFKCYNCLDSDLDFDNEWKEKDIKKNIEKVNIIIRKIEEKKIIKKEIKEIKEIKDISKIENKLYNWLKVYTKSYINHKFKYNLNSIKNETNCIKVEWWYILHSDIIENYKINYKINKN
jgi:hypothetical protein